MTMWAWRCAGALLACAVHVVAQSASTTGEATRVASTVRGAIPRFTGPARFAPRDPGYQDNLIALASIGLSFAFFTLVALGCYCRARWCRRPADAARERARQRAGFSMRERVVPGAALVFLCVVSFSFCSTGIAENESFTKTLRGSDETAFTRFMPALLDEARARVRLFCCAFAHSLRWPCTCVTTSMHTG